MSEAAIIPPDKAIDGFPAVSGSEPLNKQPFRTATAILKQIFSFAAVK